VNKLRRRAILCALGAVVFAAACGSDKPDNPATVTAADAYNAAIRWYLGTVPEPTGTADPKPEIVFVAPASGKPIDVRTQAAVAAEMSDKDDVVMVQFTDVIDDALDVDLDGRPVKDDGVLLIVGDVTEVAPPLEMNVGVYRNENDDKLYSMKVIPAGDSFVATSVIEVVQG
jgi:hypothetical protein